MSGILVKILEAVKGPHSNAIKTIDVDHYEAYDGGKFFYPVAYQSLATTATYAVSFTTPTVASGKEIHWRPPLVSDSADKLRITLYEDDVYSGGSDGSVSVFNYLRKSTNTTAMQDFKYGTTKGSGTLLYPDYIGGGTSVGGTNSGGVTSQKEEIILKANSKYTLLFTNNSSGTNIINAILNWYEEEAI